MAKGRPIDEIATELLSKPMPLTTSSFTSHPTRNEDLQSMRSHRWDRENGDDLSVTCLDCELEFTHNDFIRGLPPCPGPEYILIRRSTGKHRSDHG